VGDLLSLAAGDIPWGLISWGNVPWLFAIGGAFLVAFGGFAYLIGSFFIGLFSKVPQDGAAVGPDSPPQATR
jgi:hypothetical protein